MAIAFVNKGSVATVDTGTGLTVSYAGAVANNFVVNLIAVSRFTATPAALTLPTGWTTAENNAGTGTLGGYINNVGIFFKAGISSGAHSAVYSGWNSLSAANGIIAEFSGLDTSTPLDTAHNHNSGSSGTAGSTGSSGTASQADIVWIGILSAENGANTSGFTSSIAGYTTIANLTSDATGVAWWCGYKIVSSTAAENLSSAWTNSSVWTGAIAGFKMAGGVVTPINDYNWKSLTRGLGQGLSRGLKYTNKITLEAYYREQERKHREFINKVKRAA
jgi:hypothetical protein